jgi:hypothetical protein
MIYFIIRIGNTCESNDDKEKGKVSNKPADAKTQNDVESGDIDVNSGVSESNAVM